MSHRRATGQSSHRPYSWTAKRAATSPIGSHCGSGTTAYGGLPACPLRAGALRAGAAWQVGATVPRWPIVRPSDPRDMSFEISLFLTLLRTPLLMGYALTIEQIYFFAKSCFRIASECRLPVTTTVFWADR